MILAPNPSFEAFRRLVAPEVKEPPPANEFFDRWLNNGGGRACLFLPFLGEFGHLIMSHLRMVHFHKASRKVVCCRPGEQVLFPSAAEFVTDWRDAIDDADRVGPGNSLPGMWPGIVEQYPDCLPIAAGCLWKRHQLYAVEPDKRIPFRPKRRGLKADVVLGVRRRCFAPEKNWPHWQALADRLAAFGVSFAVIGDKQTSLDLPGQVCHSGDYDTDAAIELLENCRLYVGTDTGASHLASTVGARTLVFRQPEGGHRNLIPRMEEVNPGRIVTMPDWAWKRPNVIAEEILSLIEGVPHQ